MNKINRRSMLGLAGAAACGAAMSKLSASAQGVDGSSGLRFFDVKTFGATGIGKVLDSAAINRAIDACHAAGGGTVYVSPGTYLCGTVVLKSNVTLYLETGATLMGSKSISDYTPQPFKLQDNVRAEEGGVFDHDAADTTASHLVFARDAENIGLAGAGRIDGQGPSFWVPSGKLPSPPEDAWKDVATHAWKATRRPSPMLEFYNCRNFRIEDIRIENSAGWTLRTVDCENVFIHGISIKNPVFGINTDGIDLIGCKNVFISDCLIDTGDDAICMKSENPYGGPVKISKNIAITNCILTCCCNGLKFGTATYGGFENITFSNSIIYNDAVPLNERVISGVAVEMVDGGSLEGVVISNIRMQRVRTPIFIRRALRHPRADGSAGVLRGIMIENIHATGSILTSSITGLPGFNVEDVTLSNVRIDSEERGSSAWVDRQIPEVTKDYPEARMFGRLPAYGFYCRHVRGLRLRQVEVTAVKDEERPGVVCDDVADLEISGLRGSPISGSQSVVKLLQTQRAFIQGCVAPAGAAHFLELAGDQTAGVVLMNNDLGGADKSVKQAADVPLDAVRVSGNIENKA